jgi:lipopolysaccharide biosynthesis glycosyltransferase
MKWYFAFSEATLATGRDMWEAMIAAALASCRTHTDLSPHCLFDGGEDPFIRRLESEGVTVTRHQVAFYDALAAHRPDDPKYLRVVRGMYLRTEIPAIECEEEFVLYTDCDVMFTGPVELTGCRPRFMACAPQFHLNDRNDLNSGVMLMNVPALRVELDEFRRFITGNLSDGPGHDQAAYREFYRDRIEPLDLSYNWRPYWGVDAAARIVHFHGPKPGPILQMLLEPDYPAHPVHRSLYEQNPQGYRHYLGEWLEYAGEAAARI